MILPKINAMHSAIHHMPKRIGIFFANDILKIPLATSFVFIAFTWIKV